MGDSGATGRSFDGGKSLEEDANDSGLGRSGGCGEGDDLGESLFDPLKDDMNDNTN